MEEDVYTTATAARVLGVTQDYVKRLAWMHGIGSQPGGPSTPYVFTMEELKDLSQVRAWKHSVTLDREDPRVRNVDTPDALGRELDRLLQPKK